ncbi:MAG: V-type ATP synthase subunit F [Gammaproteobacteria bacterium]|jgi:vacuolar-type H+-ATPase subunit F/Vma7
MRVLFLGDELSAAAFRMAGCQSLAVGPEEALLALEAHLPHVDMLIMTVDIARGLPADVMRDLRQRTMPLVLEVPDVRRLSEPGDFTSAIRSHLGLREDFAHGASQ